MKILFIGDYSNYHRCVAGALRKMGHEVTVASNGSRWLQTERDIDLSRPFAGKIGGLALWLKIKKLSSKLTGYDVVQINNPIFLDLRPNRVKTIFDFLKENNRSIFLTAMGNDTAYARMCTQPDSPLRYSEWMLNGKPSPHHIQKSHILKAWLQPPVSDFCNYVYQNVNGVVTALYEYHLAFQQIMHADKIHYAGIPIDTEALELSVSDEIPQKVRFFLGMHKNRKVEKGTDRMLTAVQDVVKKHPDKCTLQIIENVPYKEYIKLMCDSHVIIDQLYSYTPATNALLGMAYGLTAVTGAEPEFYDFIEEYDNHPIINAIPDDTSLFNIFEEIALHPELIPQRATQNRDFVLKHNDAKVVANRFLEFWNKQLYNL